MEFKQIRLSIIKENAENFRESIKRIDTITEYNDTKEKALKLVVSMDLGKYEDYKGTYEEQKAKTIKALDNKYKKMLIQEMEEVGRVEEAEDFGKEKELVLTIEWKKSNMWGSNPTASTNYGFNGSSIGGCGYDKLSTASSEALNSDLSLMKLLYMAKEKAIKKYPMGSIIKNKHTYNECIKVESQNDISRNILGYGSGYGIRPHFEGGVGVSSHQTIIARLGLEMKSITDTKNVNVYVIRRVSK